MQGQQHPPAKDRGQHHRSSGPLQPDAPGQYHTRFSPGARVGSGLVGGGGRMGG